MPIVGTSTSRVIFAASSEGIPSSTIENTPASVSARASSRIRSAASSSRPWTRKPPIASTDCGVSPR